MIAVFAYRQAQHLFFPLKTIKTIVVHVCKKEKIRSGAFSFVFVNDPTIRSIHKRYLGHNTVTDIITFPLEEGTADAEIYINVQQARRQAKIFGVSLQNEMIRLVVHGVLHVAGYDDRTPRLRKKMFEVQERYVAELSL